MADKAIKRLCGLDVTECEVGVLLRIRGHDAEPDSWKRVSISEKLAVEFRAIAKARATPPCRAGKVCCCQ